MFQVGQTVVYGTTGVCTVLSVGPLSMQGMDRKQQYYTLNPLYQDGTVYVPLEGQTKSRLRLPMTQEEARALLERIPAIESCPIQQYNYKQRSDVFSAALHENNGDSLVSIIKAVEEKKRRGREKQQYNADNNFHKRAMNLLCGELAFALGQSLEQIRAQVEDAVRSSLKDED